MCNAHGRCIDVHAGESSDPPTPLLSRRCSDGIWWIIRGCSQPKGESWTWPKSRLEAPRLVEAEAIARRDLLLGSWEHRWRIRDDKDATLLGIHGRADVEFAGHGFISLRAPRLPFIPGHDQRQGRRQWNPDVIGVHRCELTGLVAELLAAPGSSSLRVGSVRSG